MTKNTLNKRAAGGRIAQVAAVPTVASLSAPAGAPNADERPLGRPSLPDEERLDVVSIRLTANQKKALRHLGNARLRAWLDGIYATEIARG